mgnify:CR=1 FL=1
MGGFLPPDRRLHRLSAVQNFVPGLEAGSFFQRRISPNGAEHLPAPACSGAGPRQAHTLAPCGGRLCDRGDSASPPSYSICWRLPASIKRRAVSTIPVEATCTGEVIRIEPLPAGARMARPITCLPSPPLAKCLAMDGASPAYRSYRRQAYTHAIRIKFQAAWASNVLTASVPSWCYIGWHGGTSPDACCRHPCSVVFHFPAAPSTTNSGF